MHQASLVPRLIHSWDETSWPWAYVRTYMCTAWHGRGCLVPRPFQSGDETSDMARALVSVSRVAAALRELVGKYEDMVVKDPALTSRIESALRLASYILPGKGFGLGTRHLAACMQHISACISISHENHPVSMQWSSASPHVDTGRGPWGGAS